MLIKIAFVADDAAFRDFTIDEFGILAYSLNPELFQQVYILEMSDSRQ